MAQLSNLNHISPTILQWNCNGFYRHIADLKQLLNKYTPYSIAIQESRIKTFSSPKLNGYQCFFTNSNNVAHASGGVLLCITSNIKCEEIILNTHLQAVAVIVHFPIKHTICNIYIPPNQIITTSEIHNILTQLPEPYILLGDMNAHSPIWGSHLTDRRGKVFETILHNTNLVCLNDGSNTHITFATGTLSAIDLTFTTPNMSLDLEWETDKDCHNSDHFPIIIKFSTIRIPQSKRSNWIVKAADWNSFETSCEDITPSSINEFTSQVIEIAQNCIPKSSNVSHKRQVPWWNAEIATLIKTRKQMLRIFEIHPTLINNINFKKARAKARQAVQEAKRVSWIAFIESINNNTTPKDLYTNINKIRGRYKTTSIPVISVNNISYTDQVEVANFIGQEFQNASSSSNYNQYFHKNIHELNQLLRNIPRIHVPTDESYNSIFTIDEFNFTLQLCKGSSPGPDEIHYDMIKHLPSEKKLVLLQLFNDIWTQKTSFPTVWQKATVIPILKPGKNSTSAESYRPISLTSCLCKLMEGMVNRRLVWLLENNNYFLNRNQAGFRRKHSTIDHLVTLESAILQAFYKKNHLIAVFFDINKAYQMVWKPLIFENLKKLGIVNNMYKFIKNFLSNRTFQVSNGSRTSVEFKQENGIPQGSKISVTLFLIAINNVMDNIVTPVNGLLFADDLVIYMEHKNHKTINKTLQNTIKLLEKWSTTTGFIFSTSKSKIVHFCRKRKPHIDLPITMFNEVIPVSNNVKFLGLEFDKKLSWNNQIATIYKQGMSNLNIIKILGNRKWGIDEEHMYKIFNTIIRSRIEYGAIAYDSAKENKLRKLEVIQNAALRIITGAFRSSPIDSILSISGYTSLKHRRICLTAIYATKIFEREHHPLKQIIQSRINQPIGPSTDFVSRATNLLVQYDINILQQYDQPRELEPWTQLNLQFIEELNKFKKDTTTVHTYHQLYNSICSKHQDFIHIYTDGSKTTTNTGCAFVTNNIANKFTLPDACSIFTAEAIAILNAIKHTERDPHEKFLIFTDSASVIKSIQNRQHSNIYIKHIQHSNQIRKQITLVWIPSHIGIKGNEEADQAACSAANELQTAEFSIPISDQKSIIKYHSKTKWNSIWTNLSNNKLRSIKTSTEKWLPPIPLSRSERMSINRLRIGHTHITHSHLMKKEPPEDCEHCHTRLTVEHILIHCSKFSHHRLTHQLKSTLHEILSNEHDTFTHLIRFLRDSDLVDKI